MHISLRPYFPLSKVPVPREWAPLFFPYRPRSARAIELSMEAVKIRPSALAGTWYPEDPNNLRMSVEAWLMKSRSESGGVEPKSAAHPGRLLGLILPHAGHKYSGLTCASGAAAVRSQKIRTLIMIGPSHRVFVAGAALSAATHFETPLGAVTVDQKTVGALAASGIPFSDAAHAKEHCLEILLPFFQILLKDFQIVPILVGAPSCADSLRLAERIRNVSDGQTLLVASSDFVHYGAEFNYLPPVGSDVRAGVRKIDEGAIEQIRALDSEGLLAYRQTSGATICGIVPIAVVLDALPKSMRVEQIHYSQSAEITGDTGHMVSYAALAMYDS